MEQKNVFKDVMSFNEMVEAFKVDYSYFVPNMQRVGRYAKKNGYVPQKQVINRKQVYFYVKSELVK